jgi:acyl-coenzyme A thioesterase PaaI-like protein
MSNHTHTAPAAASLQSLRADAHPFCLVCSQSNPLGLGLNFVLQADGSVNANFISHAALEGYAGLLHGGVIAAVLDGAMTNCLFARGLQAVTGELTVRYRHPVPIGGAVTVRAWIQESLPPLHLLQAELQQDGCVKASASAKFMERYE